MSHLFHRGSPSVRTAKLSLNGRVVLTASGSFDGHHWDGSFAACCENCGRDTFLSQLSGGAPQFTVRFSCSQCRTDYDVVYPPSGVITLTAVTSTSGVGMWNASWLSGTTAIPITTVSFNLTASPVSREQETPPERLPTLSGEVIGFRAWRLNDWRLLSSAVTYYWEPGVNTARCLMGTHDAPHVNCECGLYAHARVTHGAWWGPEYIVGAIAAWGDQRDDNRDGFVLHATGFRAQYARIVLLVTDYMRPRARNALIRDLADQHGAGTCEREYLETAAMEHGQLVPDELLRWAALTDTTPPEGY